MIRCGLNAWDVAAIRCELDAWDVTAARKGSHGSSGKGRDGSKVSTRSGGSKESKGSEGSKGSKGSEGSDGSSGKGSDGSKVGTRSTRSGSKGDSLAALASNEELMGNVPSEYVVNDFIKVVAQELTCQDKADGKSEQHSKDKYASLLHGQTENLSTLIAQLLGDDMVYDDYFSMEHSKFAVDNGMYFSDLQHEDVTTMMIRNLPARLRQSQLTKAINADGFHNTYDFIYMPCVLSARQGKGYAFVNFATSELAAAFQIAWNGNTRFNMNWSKVLSVAPSSAQGKEANMALWQRGKNKHIRHPEFRPLVKESLFALN